MNTKTLYTVTNFVLVTLFAIALLLVPAFNSTGTVSAQKGARQQETVSPEAIGRAVNLESATGFAAFAENGITDNGSSIVRGNVGVARPSAVVKGLNGGNVKGLIQDGNVDMLKAQKDLSNSFDVLSQLPCTEVNGTDLGGRRFTPGIYCLSSAALAGDMILDGENNSNGIFIFRVEGNIRTEKGSSISLVNKAAAPYVYFVAGDSAVVGEDSNFEGNLLARNSIKVDGGANVQGRVLSVKGDISLSGSVLGPQAPGFLEICKAIDATGGTGLENRIFRFSVPGGTNSTTGLPTPIVEVPAGQCSGPIQVEQGQITVTELQTGRTTTGGTFNSNFQLTSVIQLPNVGQTTVSNPNAVVSANLPLFQAVINITPGTIAEQTRVQFTNRFAIIAIVEICKDALDTGVPLGSLFNFTINGVNQGNGQPGALVNFSVPTGQCSGRIAVTVPSDVNSGPPRTGTAVINELPRSGFIFTSATTAVGAGTIPNRLQTFNVLANGGGNAVVTVVAGTDGGATDAGATTLQTTAFFNNRTAPGQLKICKVAGPGIAELAPFNFSVSGIAPFAPVTVDTAFTQGNNPTPPNGIIPATNGINNGTIRVGAVPQGGNLTTQVVNVLAGPANNPGGFCQIVPGTFVVDTRVLVNELGVATGATTGSFSIFNINNTTGVAGVLRLSRITSSTGIIAGANASSSTASITTNPLVASTGIIAGSISSPLFTPGDGSVTGAFFPIRRGVTEVEFVNTAFAPVPLKVCKVAGTGVAVGTPFTFTVVADTAGGLLAPFSSTITVNAGPAAVNPGDPNGFCDFATGPFTPGINNLGSFNFNSMVTVTEAASTTTVVAPGGITSPTGGVIANVGARSGVISNMINGVNEIQFVNQAGTAQGKLRKRARFVQ